MLRNFLLFVFVLVLSMHQVYAVCSFVLDKEFYHPGEYQFYDMWCGSAVDCNKPYQLLVRNSTGGSIHVIDGTTSSTCNKAHFYEQYQLLADLPLQNNSYVNFTVDGVYQAQQYFDIFGLSTSDLQFVDLSVLYDGDWYWEEINAIGVSVYDYLGNSVVGAWCKMDIFDSVTNQPYFTLDGSSSGVTGSTGQVIFPVNMLYDIFDYDTDYKFTVSCQTSEMSPVSSFLDYEAHGYITGYFRVNAHIEGSAASYFVYPDENGTYIAVNTSYAGDHIVLCLNATNSYRDYTQAYIVNVRLLCDVPHQDVVMYDKSFSEVYLANESIERCYPIIIPEGAAYGSGNCRVGFDVWPEQSPMIRGNYVFMSDIFTVLPRYPVLLEKWVKMDSNTYSMVAAMAVNLSNWTIYVDLPTTITEQLDRVESVTLIYGGETFDGFLSARLPYANKLIYSEITGVEDLRVNSGVVMAFSGLYLNASVPFVVVVTIYSEVSFWQSIISVFTDIKNALFALAGISSGVVGDYSVISVAPLLVGSEDLVINYSIIANNLVADRKRLHFHYDFAKVVGGVEQSFRDQNPYRADYQGLDLYQTVALNESKNISIVLQPYLEVGVYAVYEFMTDADPVVDARESINFTKRMEINVTVVKVPEFDGIYGPDVMMAIG